MARATPRPITPYGSHPAYARHLVERAERVCTQGTCDAALADEYLEGLWVRLSEHLSGCVSFTAACKALLENPNHFQLPSGRAVAGGKAAKRGGGRGKREAGGGSGGRGKRRRSSSGSSSGGSGSDSEESEDSEEDRRRKKRRGDAGRGSPKEKKKAPKKKKSKKTPRSKGKSPARAGESEKLRAKWTKARLCFTHMRGQSCKGRVGRPGGRGSGARVSGLHLHAKPKNRVSRIL